MDTYSKGRIAAIRIMQDGATQSELQTRAVEARERMKAYTRPQESSYYKGEFDMYREAIKELNKKNWLVRIWEKIFQK